VVEDQLKDNRMMSALLHDTMTLTNMTTDSTAPNVIPKTVTATFDCRLLPGTDEKAFLDRMRAALAEDAIKIDVISRSPNHAGSQPDEVYEAFAASMLEEEPACTVTRFLFPASSDGNAFRVAGHPVFGLLPVRMTQDELDGIHGRNERIKEAELEKGVRVFLETFMRLRSWSGRQPR
jgi:acetylornithine deacetylase/succinyl-diaminopimelate desuccinylase-like protein